MIPKEELRIGNKVKVSISNDAGIYTVLGIPAWGINGHGDGKEPLVLIDRCPKELIPESKLRPIKITNEILEKCGFVEDKMFGQGWELQVKNNHSEDELWLVWNDLGLHISGVDEAIFTTVVESVHQLQNLIHSLSGEELEIKQ